MRRDDETDGTRDAPQPDLRCERVRLLLSLSLDGAATAAQEAEIEAHLPDCAGCRAARDADRAVHARCAEPATVPAGFGDRVAAAAARQRLEARAQNRFLVAASVAAVLVAAVAGLSLGRGGRGGDGGPDDLRVQAARDTAGHALRAGLAVDRSPRGRTPGSGTEDR